MSGLVSLFKKNMFAVALEGCKYELMYNPYVMFAGCTWIDVGLMLVKLIVYCALQYAFSKDLRTCHRKSMLK